MDVLNEEFLSLWKCLNECGVKYIMVGGFATNFHGFSRMTKDADLWIEDSGKNRKKFRQALEGFGLGDMRPVENMQFVPGWTSLNTMSGFPLDIMTHIKGLENIPFDECLSAASVANLNGILVPFLHINHLIMAKKASARPKDLVDIVELEKIKELRKK